MTLTVTDLSSSSSMGPSVSQHGADRRTSDDSLAPSPAPISPGIRCNDSYHMEPDRGLRGIESGGLSASHPGYRSQIIPLSGTNGPGSGIGTLHHVGHLDVGDQHASIQQNSPATVAAAGPHLPDKASLDVTVPEVSARPSESARPPTSSDSPRRERDGQSSTSTSLYGEYLSDEEIEEYRHLLQRQSGRPFFLSGTGSLGGYHGAHFTPGSPNNPSSAPPASGVPGPATTRYVIDARDVHNMGGTLSTLTISDRTTGEILQRFDLPEGSSRIIADLPPGDYRFEAQAGTRPEGSASHGGDRQDNFSVDVSTTATT